MKPVAGLHDPLIELEVRFRNVILPGRMVFHEPVTEVVDRIEIHRHEIPRFLPHQKGGGRLDVGAVCHNLGQ